MTKEEAWAKFQEDITTGDLFSSNAPYPSEEDVEDAFNWGWDQAMASLQKEPEGIPYANIIDTMNAILNKHFRCVPATKKFIKARWKDGFREEDFQRVCEIKKVQWGNDPDFAKFLRPETLFGTKMDSYLNEVVIKTTVPDYL